MKKLKKIVVDYIFIALGSFILAFGINLFLVPSKISTGGASGIGMILYHIFNIPLSLTMLIINIVLFLLGYKMMKKSLITKTLAGIVSLSLFLEITARFGMYSDDILIASVFGGLLVGIGVGLAILKDASTGGSDFVALMLNKIVPHIPVTTFILMIDSTIILISGIIFKDYTIMFYSVISIYISSKVADFIVVHGDYAKSIYIISKRNDEIAKSIMSDVKRGVTGIYSKGFYNNEDRTMLMCIVKGKEIQKILKKVKQIDKNAFTIISEVIQVHGEGFKQDL